MDEIIKKPLLDHRWSSALLMLATSLFVFVLPVLNTESELATIILISIIIFLAAYNISTRLLVVGLLAIIIEIGTRTTDFVYLHYLAMLTTNMFFIYIVLSVILDIMRQDRVSLFTLLEAVNGYLLLGIMFISLVGFCEFIIPGSYIIKGDNEAMELVYYTLVTLTTVGYGDITPQLPIAKSLSMVIAVCGQFYIAVVVAIIVGKYASGMGSKQ